MKVLINFVLRTRLTSKSFWTGFNSQKVETLLDHIHVTDVLLLESNSTTVSALRAQKKEGM